MLAPLPKLSPHQIRRCSLSSVLPDPSNSGSSMRMLPVLGSVLVILLVLGTDSLPLSSHAVTRKLYCVSELRPVTFLVLAGAFTSPATAVHAPVPWRL